LEIPKNKVAVIFHRLGPYHFARLRAAGKLLSVTAIETSGADQTYAWDLISGSDGFERVTLFEKADAQKLPAREAAQRMNSALDKIQPEIVVTPGWSDKSALAAIRWCGRKRVPAVVMSESTVWDEPRKPWKEIIKRQIVGLASAALAGGTPHAEYLAQLGMARDRIFLGYDAVDNDFFAQGAKKQNLKPETRKAESGEEGTDNQKSVGGGLESGDRRLEMKNAESGKQLGLPEKYFLASARFIEKKNLPRLMEAFARYRELAANAEELKPETLKAESTSSGLQPSSPQSGEGHAPWDLVLLGDGDLRSSLESQVSSLKLQHCVLLPGFKQYPELPTYYAHAGAFIHASTTEQWGLVVNEAMASGLPVLVSNRCGCAPDLVQEGVNGFTFDPYEVEQLAQLMLKISDFRFPISDFGVASQRIIANWGPERFAQGLQSAVHKAIEVGPVKPSLRQRLILKALLWK